MHTVQLPLVCWKEGVQRPWKHGPGVRDDSMGPSTCVQGLIHLPSILTWRKSWEGDLKIIILIYFIHTVYIGKLHKVIR